MDCISFEHRGATGAHVLPPGSLLAGPRVGSHHVDIRMSCRIRTGTRRLPATRFRSLHVSVRLPPFPGFRIHRQHPYHGPRVCGCQSKGSRAADVRVWLGSCQNPVPIGLRLAGSPALLALHVCPVADTYDLRLSASPFSLAFTAVAHAPALPTDRNFRLQDGMADASRIITLEIPSLLACTCCKRP